MNKNQFKKLEKQYIFRLKTLIVRDEVASTLGKGFNQGINNAIRIFNETKRGLKIKDERMTKKIANDIWNIIIEHYRITDDVTGKRRKDFIQAMMEGAIEYRLGGILGYGGKFWNNYGFYVACSKEDETSIRKEFMDKINPELEKLYKKTLGK